MKLFIASLIALTGSFAFAQAPTDPTTQNFTLNQATTALTLDQKEFETIYRTDQVPSTCYRSEVQGTTTQCHTEYDSVCHTNYEQQCHLETYPVCQTVPRNECSTQTVCHVESSQVCHGQPQVCTTVPRSVCQAETSCHPVNDSVCHNESRNECQNVPVQSCQQVPRQACEQVPNVVQVPYACTQSVQTPIGQKLKLETKANVSVNLVNFSEVGQLVDGFQAKLDQGQVTITLPQSSKTYLFQIANQNRTEQAISDTEKVVNYTLGLKATSIAKLNSFQSLQIITPKLLTNHVEFGLSGGITVPFKGHLNVARKRTFLRPIRVLDGDFTGAALTANGSVNSLAFKSIDDVTLDQGSYYFVTLDIGLDLDALKANLINPDAISLIQNQGNPIENAFEGNPQN